MKTQKIDENSFLFLFFVICDLFLKNELVSLFYVACRNLMIPSRKYKGSINKVFFDTFFCVQQHFFFFMK